MTLRGSVSRPVEQAQSIERVVKLGQRSSLNPRICKLAPSEIDMAFPRRSAISRGPALARLKAPHHGECARSSHRHWHGSERYRAPALYLYGGASLMVEPSSSRGRAPDQQLRRSPRARAPAHARSGADMRRLPRDCSRSWPQGRPRRNERSVRGVKQMVRHGGSPRRHRAHLLPGRFGDAAMTVLQHARKPTRIGRRPRTTLATSSAKPHLGRCHLACVEMIEFGHVAEQGGGSREAADEILRRRSSTSRSRSSCGWTSRSAVDTWYENRRPPGRPSCVTIGVSRGSEIGLAQLVARMPRAIESKITGTRPVLPGAAPKTRAASALAPHFGERIVTASSSSWATRRTAISNSTICASKMSRNKPEILSVTSMRGRSRAANGSTSMPVTRLEAASHTGFTPR